MHKTKRDGMKEAKKAVKAALKTRGRDYSHLSRVAYEKMVECGYKPAVAQDLVSIQPTV